MLKTFLNKLFGGDEGTVPARVQRAGPVQNAWIGPQRAAGGPFTFAAPAEGFAYTGTNRADFYRYLRDRIPIISSGIWTWTHLCATQQQVDLQGDEWEVRQAERLIHELDRRVYPRLDGETHGLARLTEAFFLEMFTLGAFAARVKLLPDASGVSHIELLDPYRIHWVRSRDGRYLPYLENDDREYEPLDPNTFFHRTLVADLRAPGGIEPLASIPFVIEIEQRMLEDMARASHNAGTPRLQIRISPPDPNPGEDPDSYSQRINTYFDRTVSQFNELGPDDNLFTWSDIEVKVIGIEQGSQSAWKVNREQVIEDVITGLKLFPWALGRSHGTTKNWVFAQYNLLMQIVDSVQLLGGGLAEWLMRLELRLAGNPATARWTFQPNQDPFVVERNRANLMHFERVDKMVQGGYISRDQGARELGYDKAYADGA